MMSATPSEEIGIDLARMAERIRRKMSARNPLTKICAIMVPSHNRPALTCRP